MSAIDKLDFKRKAQNAYLSEDNPGCLLVLVLMLISLVVALVR